MLLGILRNKLGKEVHGAASVCVLRLAMTRHVH